MRNIINKIKYNPITRHILLLLLNIFSFINKYIPKRNRILFYESGSSVPFDNSEAFCTWLIRNGFADKYEIIYCVSDLGNFPEMQRCHRVGLLKGIHAYLTSKFVFYSYGGMRIKPSSKQTVVCLWHGMPLKCIGKFMVGESYAKEKLNDFTITLASSSLFVPIMAQAMGCTDDQVKILGLPRNDYLFSNIDNLNLLGIKRNIFRKLILWMPTYRKSNDGRWGNNFSDSETHIPIAKTTDDLMTLNQRLQTEDILLVIKAHLIGDITIENFTNIYLINDDEIYKAGMRLYEFVGKFDALITDYSSIYIDWLLLNRPLGFTLDDIEEYQEKRGFIFDDPLEIMPGRKIYTLDEFIQFCMDTANGIDKERKIRDKTTPLLDKYKDADNCERLAEYLGLVENQQ